MEVCGGGKEKIVFINYLHLVVFFARRDKCRKKNCQEKREKINKRQGGRSVCVKTAGFA